MPCKCLNRKIKHICGCISQSRKPRSTYCGKAHDGRGRKTTCPGAREIITPVDYYCQKSSHQRMRLINLMWRCCKCGTDNQTMDRCKRVVACPHLCCSSCTQGTAPRTGSGSASNGIRRPLDPNPSSSSSSPQISQSPCSSSTSSERLIFNTSVRT